MPHQQNLDGIAIAVIDLRARTTRLSDLRELLDPLREALTLARKGGFHVVSWRDPR